MIRDKLLNELLTKSLDSNGISFFGGKSGILFSLMYASESETWDDKYSNCITNLVTSLINEINSNDPSNSKYSLRDLVGCFHTFSKLKNDGLVDIEDTFFETFSSEINSHFIFLAETNDFDNLHGAFYILAYLIESRTLGADVCQQFIELFIKNFYHDNKLQLKPIKYSFTSDKEAINYSLSHGLSGKMAILLKLYINFPSIQLKQIVLEIGEHIFSLAKFENISSGKSIFPSLIHSSGDNDYGHMRLAWCYGDLGTAVALFNFFTFFQLNQKKQIVLDCLIYLSTRRGIAENGIIDAPFCHGTAGISYIFYKLFVQTGNVSFKHSSDYWEKETENFYLANKDITDLGIHGRSKNSRNCNESFLEGYAGIYLALSSKESDCFSWDSCLFLS